MSLKKTVASLIVTIIIFLFFSTSSYAATNDNMEIDLEQNLHKLEVMFSNEREHYNLNSSDIIENNLGLGNIYPNNTINLDTNANTNNLTDKLKNKHQYVSTIKLKDSNKPIALAHIEEVDSKWVIVRVNSYNLLDNEIDNYEKTVFANPIVIIDDENRIYALGSERSENDIRIIETNNMLNIKSGEIYKITDLQPKLKKIKQLENNLTGGSQYKNNSDDTHNYISLLGAIAFLACILGVVVFIKKKRFI